MSFLDNFKGKHFKQELDNLKLEVQILSNMLPPCNARRIKFEKNT